MGFTFTNRNVAVFKKLLCNFTKECKSIIGKLQSMNILNSHFVFQVQKSEKCGDLLKYQQDFTDAYF